MTNEIYGISLDHCLDLGKNHKAIQRMPIEERIEFLKENAEWWYNADSFFQLLNGNLIDTENVFWFNV